MKLAEVYAKLWKEYSGQNSHVAHIYDLFQQAGEQDILHDHIAYRTFNHPKVNLKKMGQIFEGLGYQAKQDYYFEKKKLAAQHYEHKQDPQLPKIFVSELLVEEFSPYLQETIGKWMDNVPASVADDVCFLLANNPWNTIHYGTYLKLREESEYAAWMYVYGFRVNHHAIYVNYLNTYNDIRKVNEFVKGHGYTMNQSGGEVKGSKEVHLEQSSIMAEKIDVEFADGVHRIPSCYYEFTQRYPMADGNLYTGFYASSADKIFESTNYYK